MIYYKKLDITQLLEGLESKGSGGKIGHQRSCQPMRSQATEGDYGGEVDVENYGILW